MNDAKFEIINQHYDEFYKDLLRKGKLPLRSTEKGFWGHVPARDLFEAFTQLKLQQHRTFLDLGSGDGKAVLIASLFCERAVGIEIDKELFDTSMQMQQKLQMHNALFYRNDFYQNSVTGFDVVFVYPDEPLHRNLEHKLRKELTGKLLHCGHHFHPEKLQKERQISVNNTLFTVYGR